MLVRFKSSNCVLKGVQKVGNKTLCVIEEKEKHPAKDELRPFQGKGQQDIK